MTKKIRVENADTSTYKVMVEVWDKGIDGAPDSKAFEAPLDHPTFMTEQWITSTRYLVVRENGQNIDRGELQ